MPRRDRSTTARLTLAPAFLPALLPVLALGLALSALACRTSTKGVHITQLDDGGAAHDGSVGDAASRETAPAACAQPGAEKKRPGTACSCSDECDSNFCVDGVCCNSACDGTCVACNLADSPGQCSPIAAGMAPVVAGQCPAEAVAGCGLDGMCNGAGGCRKYVDGTICTPGTCQGNTVTGAKACSQGMCVAGSTTVCSPYVCNAATGACFDKCTTSADCDGRECVAGSCGKKPLGATCSATADCDSGFCADGVCCNLDCTGTCLSCNQVGHMGECAPVPVGSPDTHNGCKAEDRTTCGSSGLCNGLGGCSKYAAGTECRAGSCSGGSEIPMSTCDGAGTCLIGMAVGCSPYVCAGDACQVACTTNADCTTGNVCTAGSCGKKQNGQTCKVATDCVSNFCVDNVCCNTACTGTCVYCALPSAKGRCTNVGAGATDPRAVCKNNGTAACGTDGKCNGNKGCETYANGTPCKGGSCNVTSNASTQQSVCKNGACTAPTAASCAPFKCSGAACSGVCASNADCVAPNTCINNSCGKKSLGAVCSKAEECGSNFCAQGVCCSSACTGTCNSCSLTGMKGTCTAVPAGGVDPGGRCAVQAATTCGTNGTCNGAGACTKFPSGTICEPASCTAGTRNNARTCDGAGTCSPLTTQMCAPYVCGGADCFSSCTTSAQCTAPNQCDSSGHCGKKGNGSSCGDASECLTNFCVEGVCCNSACGTTCKSCNVSGKKGTCSNVDDGAADPQAGCGSSPMDPCGNDGKCNGAGACRKVGTSVVCRPASCATGGESLLPAAHCDGNGNCPTMGSPQSCSPYKCDADHAICGSSCSGDGDCSMGVCTGTSCGKKGLGASCNDGSECGSNNCVDGSCCSSASCGTCQTCASGMCANKAANTSDNACADQSGNPCGTNGKCDGSGACQLKNGTCASVCGAGGLQPRSCSNGACTNSGGATSCGLYTCDPSGCPTSCSDNAGCVSGKVCTAGVCGDPPATDAGM